MANGLVLASDNCEQAERATISVQRRESPFGELLVEPVRNGIYKKKEFHGRGVKIVNMGELFANPRLRGVNMRRVELSELERHRFSVQAGDLLFARRSLVAEGAGKCCVVLEVNEPTVFESSIIRARPDPTKTDSLFLYYYFNSPIGLHALDTIRRQVAVAGITGTDLAQLPLDVPPLPEQRAIAHVLGTLDDKIELNRRMNQTLEEMARALFKSWFVDFDPVRAKAALREHALRASQPDTRHRASRILPTPALPLKGGGSRASESEFDHSPLEGESARRGALTPSSRWGETGKHRANQWREVKRGYSKKTLEQARTLRQRRTDAEGLLWHYLRGKQLGGFKFRRQQPIGPYVADFVCMPEKLVVELDGGQHAERADHDERRDAFLQSKGYRVLRFWNNELLENCFGVLERVYEALTGPPPRQAPPAATPPQGGSDKTVPAGEWTVERARAYLDSMDPQIVDLFPDRLVPSELGEIPEGWEVKALSELVELNPREPLKKGTLAPHLDMAALPISGPSPDEPVLREFKSGTRFRNSDTLFARITPCLENGKTAFLQSLPQGVVGWGSTEFIVMRSLSPVPPEYTYLLARDPQYRAHAIQSMTGTSGRQRARPEALAQYPMPACPLDIWMGFSAIAKPLFDRIEVNRRNARALAGKRDLFLPKLLSGDAQVTAMVNCR